MKLRIFDLMASRGITQLELSTETGISQGNISDWKRGRSAPKLDALIKLAEYFRVSTDYLLGLTDDPAAVATIQPMAIDGVALSASELNLIRQFRMLPDDLSRGEVIGYISHMLREAPSAGEKAV